MVTLHRSIEQLHRELVVICTMIESMLSDAVRSLSESVSVLGDIQELQPLVYQRAIRLEHKCLELLTLQQPVASDLRRIAAVLKVNQELSSISKLAVEIAVNASHFNSSSYSLVTAELEQMAYQSVNSVSESVEAYIRADESRACNAFEIRGHITKQYAAVLDALKQAVKQDADAVVEATYLLECARAISLLVDFSSNIAAHVYYLKHGRILPRRQRVA